MSMKPLGILMLDTRFPRIEGDIGNPASFDFQVIFRTMAGIGSADAVAAPPDTPVEGLPPDGSFAATFLRNGLTLDRAAVERETVAAARALVAKHPQIDTIVFECTNLPPYKAAVQKALGLRVHDVLDL